jgi:hypothetical protein
MRLNDIVDPAEVSRFYKKLLEGVTAPIWRYPFWHLDARGGYRVLYDSDLSAAAKYGLLHAYEVFEHNFFTKILLADILPGEYTRHGAIMSPAAPGFYFGFSHYEALPHPVIDAVRSGQCARIMRLAGWREIQFSSSVNRVSRAVDCTGMKHYWDESGKRYFPE